MPKPDKRCHYKIRQCQDFYLFRKHGMIYYAYFPEYGKTRSTRETNIHEAYKAAYDIMLKLDSPIDRRLWKDVTLSKKRYRDLVRAFSFFDKNKPLTEGSIELAQKKMLKAGLAGKTINNYIGLLKLCYNQPFPNFKPIKYEAVYRSCFPIIPFYHYWQKCDNRLDYLAFFAMTTGCRLSEIKTCEKIEEYDRLYIKINGTKTKNAIRVIPALPETIACMEYLQAGFRSASYKESVIQAGNKCGFDNDYIEKNHIVFHSFRKMYKTLLESCNINNNWTEYYMGHSQTRTVNQLYFIGASADDSEVYPKVIEALRRFV